MAAAAIEPQLPERGTITDQKSLLREISLDSCENWEATVTNLSFDHGLRRCGKSCRMARSGYAYLAPTAGLKSNQGPVLEVTPGLELLLCTPPPSYTAPPSYQEAILDSPPDYTTSDTLAQAKTNLDAACPSHRLQKRRKQAPSKSFPQFMPISTFVDWDDQTGIVTHKGNKKKKGKSGGGNDWNSDNEEKKDNDGEGEAGGGGGFGGNGNGAAGGDGSDGDGGGDDNDDWAAWTTGKSKKDKKKAKKGKGAVDEEEEDKKKQEEEAANALSWADEVKDTVDDDWGFAPAGKKKKEKKKKNDPDPVGDLGTNAFDDINLQDDKIAAPNIDMSFGETGKKDTGSSFGFGNWNPTSSAWGNKSNWNITDSGTADTKETKASKDTNLTSADSMDLGWSFGGSKNKKKESSIGTGFDFGDFSAGTKIDDYKIEDDEDKNQDDGFGWPSFGKKDKKKKDKLVEEVKDLGNTGTTEISNEVDDSWGAGVWGAGKKAKKKGKNAELEDSHQTSLPPPDSSPAAFEDDWLTSAATGKKKKGKKGVAEEVKPEKPVVTAIADPEPNDTWGVWSKKDKKKKAGEDTLKDLTKDSDPIVGLDSGAASKKGTDDIWGFGSKKDKEKDKKKKADQKEEPTVTESGFGASADFSLKDDLGGEDDFWNHLGQKNNDKDKDKKKGKKDPEVPTKESEQVVTDSKPNGLDDTFGTWGTGTIKGRKTKKAAKEEPKELIIEEPIVAATTTTSFPDDEGDWTGWATSNRKKDKKGLGRETKVDEIPILPPPPSVPEPPADDMWGTAVTKKGKNAKKKGATSNWLDFEPTVTVVPESIPEAEKEQEEDFDSWIGLSAKEKKKKEKEKKKKEEEEKKKREEEEKTKSEEEEAKRKLEEEAKQKEEAKKKEEEDKKNKKKGKKGTVTKSKEEEIVFTPVPDPPSAFDDDDGWGSMWSSSKKKTTKKGKEEFEVPPPVPTPPAMGLTPEPEEQEQEQDEWASFSFSKTDKKSKKDTTKIKDKKKNDDLFAAWDESVEHPKKEKAAKASREEAPTKTVRSIWGSTTKPKSTKDKEKDKAKEDKEKEDDKLKGELIDLVDNETVFPAAKSTAAKTKPGSKLSRTVSKNSDKSSTKAEDKKKSSDLDALLDLGDDGPELADSTKGKEKKAEDKKAATGAWSFWGADSKKTGVKKEKEAKEIGKSDSANKKSPLSSAEISEPLNAEKAREDAINEAAEESFLTDFKSSGAKPKMKSTVGKSSVAERVKALETGKSKLTKTSDAKDKKKEKEEADEPPPPQPSPQLEPAATKKSGTSKLTRTSSATTKTSTTVSSKKKDSTATSLSKTETKTSKDTVPGSFPDDLFDGDLLDVADAPIPPDKPKSKTIKSKSKKKSDPLPEDNMDDLLTDTAPVTAAPPTPPPEPKPAKKERAKITKDENASSWGFWGATPKKSATATTKKSSKSKDDAEITSPAKEKPSISRSKSTRTPKEKEKEDSRSSGGSDKDKESKPRSRSSRQGSFAGFFGGGPPPTRTKSVRRSSNTPKATSRRESSAGVAASGIPSPPPEDELGLDDTPEMNSKAAKLMGVGGKSASKSKAKGKKPAVPDPYAIDDDDMVMVNPIEDPVVNAPIPKKDKREKLSRSKSKREVRKPQSLRGWKKPARRIRRNQNANPSPVQSNVLSDPADDIVMVDGPSTDAPEVITGPEDIAFVEKPRDMPTPLKRSNTSSKKQESGFMGLFGLRKSNKQEPPKALSGDEAYGGSRRKRSAATPDDDAKRLRRSRRPEKPDDNEGFTTDAGPAGNITEISDAEARRSARRARREEKERTKPRDSRRADEERQARQQLNDKAATEARKAKIREAREKRAKGEDAVPDERSASKDKSRDEAEDTVTEQIPKLKRRGTSRNETEDERRARHKAERRRSNFDGITPLPTRTADEEADRRAARRDREGRTSSSKKEKRKSTAAAPVTDYFDARNGGSSKNDPYTAGSGAGASEDKTSSWVNSQVLNPPVPPPVEGTVLESDPVMGPNGNSSGVKDPDDEEVLSEGEQKRRRRRADRRKSRAERVLGEEEASRRRRKAVDGERGSEGSEERERERERGLRRRSTGYGNAVGLNPTVGGSSGGAAGKRQSWFKKIAGM